MSPKLSNLLKIFSISQAVRTKKIVCSGLLSGAHWVKIYLELPRETKPPFKDRPDLLKGCVQLALENLPVKFCAQALSLSS